MPSNREHKGKGNKGRNDDEQRGVGTPDLGDAGNLQSANRGQPGGTPAQGKSWRGQGNQQNSDLASGPGDNAQRGDRGSRQSSDISQGNQSGSDLDSGPDDNLERGSRQGGTIDRNQQSGGRGSRSGNLSQDDLDDSM